MSKHIGCVTYSVTKCKKCGEIRETSSKRCKSCASKYSVRYQSENRETIAAQSSKYYAANKDSIIEYQKQYAKNNKEKIAARAKVYVAEHKDETKAYKAAHYAENIDYYKTKAKLWNEANVERAKLRAKAYYNDNIDERLAYHKNYRSANRDKIFADVTNRKMRIRMVEGKLSQNIRSRLYDIQGGLCPCCGEILGENFHLDHIVPISLGGLNDDSNVQLLRDKCNLEKSDTPASIWAERKELEMFFENGLTRFRKFKGEVKCQK